MVLLIIKILNLLGALEKDNKIKTIYEMPQMITWTTELGNRCNLTGSKKKITKAINLDISLNILLDMLSTHDNKGFNN